MKKLYFASLLYGICMLMTISSHAQVSLPHTLTFTAVDPTHWSDGIAEDGDGGSADISGLNIMIYTAGMDHTSLYAGSNIVWHDNNYLYSGSAGYTAITSGPDVPATLNGVNAMVLKSADNSVNFSLQAITLYDWGYANLITIETYDNGIKVGSVDFTPDGVNYIPGTVSQADLLTPAYFSNIDEIRFFPKAPNTIFNLSMNNISLGAPSGTLPVIFSSVNARQQDKNIAIQWQVENESGILKYDVEQSADGHSFTSIGNRNAAAYNGGAATYQWLDDNAITGNNFYRIKSTSVSGKVTYSTIIKMYNGLAKPALVIYPNPVTGGTVHLQINNLPAGIYLAKLVNSAGQVVAIKSITHAAGNSSETLNLGNLAKGMYLLKVIHPDHTESKSTLIAR
ncbi:hypothetical protein BH11BAC3_BH11BAC3_02070 [soil metagenome]